MELILDNICQHDEHLVQIVHHEVIVEMERKHITITHQVINEEHRVLIDIRRVLYDLRQVQLVISNLRLLLTRIERRIIIIIIAHVQLSIQILAVR